MSPEPCVSCSQLLRCLVAVIDCMIDCIEVNYCDAKQSITTMVSCCRVLTAVNQLRCQAQRQGGRALSCRHAFSPSSSSHHLFEITSFSEYAAWNSGGEAMRSVVMYWMKGAPVVATQARKLTFEWAMTGQILKDKCKQEQRRAA